MNKKLINVLYASKEYFFKLKTIKIIEKVINLNLLKKLFILNSKFISLSEPMLLG